MPTPPPPTHSPLGWNPSWKDSLTYVGEGPRGGRVWKKKPDNWPKVNKDPEELPYISDLNHLFPALLLIRKDAHTLSLRVCISA